MKRSQLLILAIFLSIGIHLILLFIVNKSGINPAEYGIKSSGGGSTEVDLVAHSPNEEENPPKIKPTPIKKSLPKELVTPDDVVKPKLKKTKPSQTETPSQPEKTKTTSPSNEEKTGSGNPGQGSGPAHSGAANGSTNAKPDYLRNPPPEYPEESRDNHEEGVVILLVEVSETGTAMTVSLHKSSGFKRLDDSAIRSVKGWKFKPATKDGSPIQSRVEVPVRFRLN